MLIANHLNKWIESITDPVVRKIAKNNACVSGGAISSALLGDKVNDYDVYFKTRAAAEAVARYYVEKYNVANPPHMRKGIPYTPEVRNEVIANIRGEEEDRVVIYMKSAGVAADGQKEYKYYEMASEAAQDEFFEDLETSNLTGSTMEQAEQLVEISKDKSLFKPVFLSDNAITLSGKIQLIIRFYGDMDAIHRNFDFVHCHGWYDHSAYSLTLSPAAMEALLTKTLIYTGSLYPIASVFRLRKFIARGWRISAGQILKILFQISEVNLKDPVILREQLIGVDQAYMSQLLQAIENDKGKRIDATYIAGLIDSIFDMDMLES